MAKLNDMYVFVESESVDYPIEATEQPVESGLSMTDHVHVKAMTLNLNGFIVGEDASTQRKTLLAWQRKGELIKYVGRNTFQGLITAFNTIHDTSAVNGFAFTLTLTEIRMAIADYVESLPTNVQTQIKSVKNAGRKQTQTNKKK